MISGVWGYLASPGAAFGVGALLIALLIRGGYHRNADGSIGRRRLASTMILGASTYTFGLVSLSQLILHGPDLGDLCKLGFGSTRMAYLLVGVVLDGVFRIWDEFRHVAPA